MANSVSKTCVAKVRVMAAVVACGSRMTTSLSSTTFTGACARARGAIHGRASPPAIADRRVTTGCCMTRSLPALPRQAWAWIGGTSSTGSCCGPQRREGPAHGNHRCWHAAAQRALPPLDGTLALPGVSAPATVLRDAQASRTSGPPRCVTPGWPRASCMPGSPVPDGAEPPPRARPQRGMAGPLCLRRRCLARRLGVEAVRPPGCAGPNARGAGDDRGLRGGGECLSRLGRAAAGRVRPAEDRA
jgi:hypothetical protein